MGSLPKNTPLVPADTKYNAAEIIDIFVQRLITGSFSYVIHFRPKNDNNEMCIRDRS